MCFSRWAMQMGAVGALVVNLGCGLRLGEDAPQDPKPAVSADVSCLSNLGDTVDRYIRGELMDSEIRRVGTCIQDAFRGFARTRGADINHYQPDEIRFFIEQNFIRDRKISDEFLHELMVLKRTLVGGSDQLLTRDDLRAGVEFAELMTEQALKINAFMDIYNFGRFLAQPKGVDENINRRVVAARTLEEVATAIGSYLKRSNGPYSTQNLERFVGELRKFLRWEESRQGDALPVEQWLELFKSYRSVAAGQVELGANGLSTSKETIAPHEWQTLLSSIAGWYGLVIRADSLNDKPSLLHGEGLEELIRFFDELTLMVHRSIDAQPDQVVRFEQLDQLVDRLGEFGWLPSVPGVSGERKIFSSSTLKMALRPTLSKIFGDPKTPPRERATLGLNRFIWSQVIAEFSQWADVQKLISRVSLRSNGDNGISLLTPDGLLRQSPPQSRFQMNPGAFASQILGEMSARLSPMFRSGSMRVHIGETSALEQMGVVHGLHNLSIMNGFRAFSMLLGRGYSSIPLGPNPFDSGVTEEELQAWYEDFRPVGVELKLMDPRSYYAGRRTFNEGNLFTRSGNGLVRENSPEVKQHPVLSRLSLSEGIEVGAFMFSSGDLSRALYSDLMHPETGRCYQASVRELEQRGLRGKDQLSVHGFMRLDGRCFEQEIVGAIKRNADSFPSLILHLEDLTPEEEQEYLSGWMTFVGQDAEYSGLLEWNDVTVVSVLMHYMESVMIRYNQDGDLTLSGRELWQAFDTFQVFLSRLIRKECESVMSLDPKVRRAMNSSAEEKSFWSPLEWDMVSVVKSMGCSDALGDMMAPGVFTFLIKQGRAPSGFIDMVKILGYSMYRRHMTVDRTRLLNVFAALVNAQNGKK